MSAESIQTNERASNNRLAINFLYPEYGKAFLKLASGSDRFDRYHDYARNLLEGLSNADEQKVRAFVLNAIQPVIDFLETSGSSLSSEYKIAKEKIQMDEWNDYHLRLNGEITKPEHALLNYELSPKTQFAHNGADITLSCEGSVMLTLNSPADGKIFVLADANYSSSVEVNVIANVSDNYPDILREAKKMKSDCLLVENYTADLVCKDEFVELFRRGGVRVVFHEDVLAKLDQDQLSA